ncbi:MAG TPA: M48 family metallopeptidase [Longimicrobiaceae bacterium]|nr:M48 family metallopeptidase [Longimicrobiaceae bacterium]
MTPNNRKTAGALLALVVLGACASRIGVEEEEQLGDSFAAEITREVALIRDPAAVAALNRIGTELVQQADSSGRRYDFYLVDSPEVNAFAIPGGHIYVNRGLIEHADDLSELAGVLGHEIAHVTERHGLEQLEKQQGANLLLTLVYTLLGREPGVLEQVAIQGGGAAIFAKYGRDAEREADLRAVEILVAAGYDPEGIATFFETLLRGQRSQPGLFDQWFASHPASEERVVNTRAVIRSLGPLDGDRLVRDTPEYQRFRARVRTLGGSGDQALRSPPGPRG